MTKKMDMRPRLFTKIALLSNIAIVVFAIFFLISFFETTSHIESARENSTPSFSKSVVPSYTAHTTKDNTKILHVDARIHQKSLPKIQDFLCYYGYASRPDNLNGKKALIIGIAPYYVPLYIQKNAPLYLDFSFETGELTIQKSDKKTNAWVSFDGTTEEARVDLHVLDDQGKEIATPAENAHFIVPAITLPQNSQTIRWTIDTLPVQDFVFEKNYISFLGENLLLNEYDQTITSKTYVFTCTDPMSQTRSIFYLEPGMYISYKNGKFYNTLENSHDATLFVFNRITSDNALLTIWHPNGKNRFDITLPTRIETSLSTPKVTLVNTQQKKEWTIDIDGQKLRVREGDWLYMSDTRWKVIQTIDIFEELIQGTYTSELIIIDQLLFDTTTPKIQLSHFSPHFVQREIRTIQEKITSTAQYESPKQVSQERVKEEQTEVDDEDYDSSDYDGEDEDEDNDE